MYNDHNLHPIHSSSRNDTIQFHDNSNTRNDTIQFQYNSNTHDNSLTPSTNDENNDSNQSLPDDAIQLPSTDSIDDSIQLINESMQLPSTSNESIQLHTCIPYTNRYSTYKPTQTTNSKAWKIMYSNIRGLKGKRSSLIEHLNSEKPHLFLLTETFLPTNADIGIDGYKSFCRAREKKQGGGVAILVRDDITNTVIPHISQRPIELIWVSVRRRGKSPLFIGCYYGKQEARCNKNDIDDEMFFLSEEIEEYSNEGDIFMAMDANGKVGILGEEKSRNGKLLEEVFKNNNLQLLNNSHKCKGKVTRQNTKNPDEKSAIDFMVYNESILDIINWMQIDEEGLLKLKGNTDTDHNTITAEILISDAEIPPKQKTVVWRLNAPDENWKNLTMNCGDWKGKCNIGSIWLRMTSILRTRN